MKRLVFRGYALAMAAAISGGAVGAENSSGQPAPKPSARDISAAQPVPAAAAQNHIVALPPLQKPATPAAYVSPWVREVVKLNEAGIDPQVIISFISAAGTFNLTSDQVSDLNERGVPGPVISAMLSHDSDLRAGLLPLPAPPPSDPEAKLPAFVSAPAVPKAVITTASKPLSEPSTFVHPSPAEDQPPVPAFDPDNRDNGRPQRKCHISEPLVVQTATARPVREPFPVQLTDPIRVFRAGWRTPNIQILQTLP